MKAALMIGAAVVLASSAFAADVPVEAHPQCMESLKAAETSNRGSLKKIADDSAECQALPTSVVTFLITHAAILAGSMGK